MQSLEKSSSRPLLSIKDLAVEYRTLEGTVHAVNGLDLEVREGKALGLVGETGAGKTTTALSMIGLVPSPPGVITSGEIWFDGLDIRRLGERELQRLRGDKISMIFQNPMASLNPVFTVGFQIAEVIQIHHKCGPREASRRAEEMLEAVGIPRNRANDFPHEFSGGMRQRVMIAIALACRPKLLIADEPTTALDVTIQAQVLDLMKNLKSQLGGSLVMITHDLGLVAEVCDDVAVMYAGEVLEKADLEQLFMNPSHPYTRGLFGSIPSLDKSVKRLVPIAGLSPDPKKLPEGCRFHPRCPESFDLCRRVRPNPMEIMGGHYVSCWKFSGPGGEISA
ncbi:MAG: ABC transporter ATP-binding protein [Actinobacteria bacterium]|nr:ABC transporter ATP-binding protein [Actinomycetota bacterium]